MSYLDLPRIHFAGQFTTGPSTVNNITSNYNLALELGPQLWNPSGTAYFQLSDCSIQTVVAEAAKQTDALVGQPLTSTDNWGGGGVPAKIVDLDPQQQMVSMLFGLQLQIGDPDEGFVADFQPVWFQDYIGVSAAYQSVLLAPVWGSNIRSAALQTLRKISPDLLSIKFVLDAPTIVASRPAESRAHGRIVGTIGPASADAPINFVRGRLLRPVGNTAGLNFGPAIVRGRRLTIDLLNAVPFSGTTPPDLGQLEVTVSALKGETISLGTFDYSAATRQAKALVQDFDLSALREDQLELLGSAPISIGPSKLAPVFQEDASGIYVDASPYVLRMEANTTAQVQLWAGQFGVAQPDLEIDIQDATSSLPSGRRPAVGVAGPGGSALSFTPAKLTTNADGWATLTIAGGDPANARGYIDGQVYALSFHPSPPTQHPDPEMFLSILVHDTFDKAPTWENVQPIMQQYARLYPFMSFVPLTDPVALREGGWVPKLLEVFSYSIDDPRYMPVVRDLSAAKQQVIVAWLTAGAPS